MNYHVSLFLFSMLFSLPPYSMPAAEQPTKADTHGQPGHHHDKSGKAHATHGHAISRAGQPGKAGQVTRTIRVEALDAMRYAPDKLTVQSGQTVRFIVTNVGKMRHEFAIGHAEEQRRHATPAR